MGSSPNRKKRPKNTILEPKAGQYRFISQLPISIVRETGEDAWSMLNRAQFVARLIAGEDWLIRRVLDYARERGYTKYTSTLEEAWRMSIHGLTESLTTAIQTWEAPLGLDPDQDFATDPVSAFGVCEAQRHRERGVSFGMYLGLMKYYRRAYLDLCNEWQWAPSDAQLAQNYVEHFFERVEVAFCSEWVNSSDASRLGELQDTNRRMTNEKNRYLTIFESLGTPVVLFDEAAIPLNLNQAALRLLDKPASPGAAYYQPGISVPGLEWLQDEVRRFAQLGVPESRFERLHKTAAGDRVFEVHLQTMLDVSGKFDGTTAVLFDLTQLREAERERERVIAELSAALAEVRTLSGLLPICAWCRKLRDDRGYWSQIEEYVAAHTNAQVTHGMCPDCGERFTHGLPEESAER
jgi:PAS domain-containing protein